MDASDRAIYSVCEDSAREASAIPLKPISVCVVQGEIVAENLGPSEASADECYPTAQVLTIGETAKFLRCSKAHVQNLLAGKVLTAPRLPFIPLGRRKLIRRESLLRWMEHAEGGPK